MDGKHNRIQAFWQEHGFVCVCIFYIIMFHDFVGKLLKAEAGDLNER
jgi:hypothetical protein